jgi:hypothetical protein
VILKIVFGESTTTCKQALNMAGKRQGWGDLNAIPAGNFLHLQDQLSGRHFLVDTGATYSLFPHRSSAPASGPALAGLGGWAIATWGEREIPLSFDGVFCCMPGDGFPPTARFAGG